MKKKRSGKRSGRKVLEKEKNINNRSLRQQKKPLKNQEKSYSKTKWEKEKGLGG